MKDITRMKVFVKTIESGSFSEAGRQLGIVASSVSRQITAIEESLEVLLIHRSTHSISLTEAGHLYYKRIKRIIEDTHLSLTQLQAKPKGNLRISVSAEFARRYVIPNMGEFLNLYPDINLDLSTSDKVVDLLEEEIDVAIRYDSMENSSHVARVFPNTNELIIGGSPNYFKKYGVPQTPEDLKNHNCLTTTHHNSDIWYLNHLQKTHEIKVSGNITTNSGEVLLNAIMDGIGLCIVPIWFAREEINLGLIQAVLSDYKPYECALKERSVYALYPDKRYLPLKVRVFIDFLLEKLEG